MLKKYPLDLKFIKIILVGHLEIWMVFSVRETHAVAEAQQEKNARLRDAFGISPRFVEGTSLDPERRARDEAQKYPLVRTPSHEREDRDTHVAKKKKKRRWAWLCY